MNPFNLLADGLELELFVVIDQIGEVLTDDRLVGGDDHHIEIVDFQEFRSFGVGGAGHAADLVIHAEKVLEGDGRQSLVLTEDLDLLLGLDRLVQPVAVPPPVKDAAGEFIDDLHLAIDYYIIDIGAVEPEGLHRLGDIVDILKILIGIDRAFDDVVLVEQLFHMKHALIGK